MSHEPVDIASARSSRVKRLRKAAEAVGLELSEERSGVYALTDTARGLRVGLPEHTLESAERLVAKMRLRLGSTFPSGDNN